MYSKRSWCRKEVEVLFYGSCCFFRCLTLLLPIISVDGGAMKNKHLNTLLCPCTLDGNSKISHFGFVVIDLKNNLSWYWFFHNLKATFEESNDLVIMSDAHKRIANGFSFVYHSIEQGLYTICVRISTESWIISQVWLRILFVVLEHIQLLSISIIRGSLTIYLHLLGMNYRRLANRGELGHLCFKKKIFIDDNKHIWKVQFMVERSTIIDCY